MRSPRRIRNPEQLESRLLMAVAAGANDELGCGHSSACGCPACAGTQLSDGHYIGDGHDHSADIRHDRFGNAYFFDPLPADIDSTIVPIPQAADDGNGGGEEANLTVPVYHSNRTAEKKIFLDFDGETVTNTSWNFNNDGNPIHAPAYSIDDEIFAFSQVELDRIFEIWERVSEDYSPFEVDVTTEDPGEQFFKDGGRGIRVLISTNNDDARLGGTDKDWFDPAGGVGYVDSWNWRGDTPVWVFSNLLGGGIKKVSEAASHEVGHSLGLSHDGVGNGQGDDAYFQGHGNWAPIMGNGYHREITQWSKGEYDEANNTQNDLAIITTKINYREDDHNDNPNEFSDPTPLQIDGDTLSASGIIERAEDVDAFRFTVGPSASEVSLSIDPWHNSPNLNIQARLHSANGTIVAESSPTESLRANIESVLQPGEYFLAVTGVGEGDPATDGYSPYASIGQFAIDGTVVGYLGDVNNDVTVDAADIDALRIALLAGNEDPVFDLNGDGQVTESDVDALVYEILQTNYGDANLDGNVDASDFNIWNSNRFQVGRRWADGDFNGDFAVDASDLNIWSANRFTSGPPLAAAFLVGADDAFDEDGRRGAPRAALSRVVAAPKDNLRITMAIASPHQPATTVDTPDDTALAEESGELKQRVIVADSSFAVLRTHQRGCRPRIHSLLRRLQLTPQMEMDALDAVFGRLTNDRVL